MKNNKLGKKFYKKLNKRQQSLLNRKKKIFEEIKEFTTFFNEHPDLFVIEHAKDLLTLAEEKEILNKELEYIENILQILGDELK